MIPLRLGDGANHVTPHGCDQFRDLFPVLRTHFVKEEGLGRRLELPVPDDLHLDIQFIQASLSGTSVRS